jgi:hypothetical protein
LHLASQFAQTAGFSSALVAHHGDKARRQ